MAEARRLIGALSRFGLAGLANTAAGGAVILVLDLGLHAPSQVADAIGYAVGLGLGFVLNRGFVFRSRDAVRASGPRFLIAAALAFAVNQGLLTLVLGLLGDAERVRLAAQLAGMAAYSLTLFAVCRLWVFRPEAAKAAP